MSDHTHIEWTDATWNPITGCSVAWQRRTETGFEGTQLALLGKARAGRLLDGVEHNEYPA